MATFHYEAYNKNHKKVVGVVEAPDTLKAVSKLQNELGWDVNYVKTDDEMKELEQRQKELQDKIKYFKDQLKKMQNEEAKSAAKELEESVFESPLVHDHHFFARMFKALKHFISFERKEEEIMVLGVQNWFKKLRQDFNIESKAKPTKYKSTYLEKKQPTVDSAKKPWWKKLFTRGSKSQEASLFKLDIEPRDKKPKQKKPRDTKHAPFYLRLKWHIEDFFSKLGSVLKRKEPEIELPKAEEKKVLIDKRAKAQVKAKKEEEKPSMPLWKEILYFIKELFTKSQKGDLSHVDLQEKIKKKEVIYDEKQIDSAQKGIHLDAKNLKIKEQDERSLKEKIEDFFKGIVKSIRLWIAKARGLDTSTQVVDVDALTSKSKFRKGGAMLAGQHAQIEGGKRVLVLKGFGKRIKAHPEFKNNPIKAIIAIVKQYINEWRAKKAKRLSFRLSEKEIDKKRAQEALLIRGYVRTGNILVDTVNKLNEWLIDVSPVKSKDKVTFYQLLAVMVNAGIPLLKALKQLVEQADNPKLKKILLAIVYEIENGSSLSNAMKEFEDTFSDATIGMVEAGEASGQLGSTLKHIAEQEEKSHNMKSKIKGAMIYPATIIVVLSGAFIIVMLMVVPKIAELFESKDVELPLSTQILITTSDFLQGFWWLLIIIIIGIITGLKVYGSTEEGKYYLDYAKLKIPVFGTLIQKSSLARFTRQLSTLSASGLSIIKALKINADSVGNEIYKQEIIDTAEAVKRGVGIAKHIENNKLFPSLVTNMIAVGEETAQLANVSGKIADYYETEVDDMVKNMSSLIEPFIIVVIGVAVALLVSAIMTPIMSLSEVATS